MTTSPPQEPIGGGAALPLREFDMRDWLQPRRITAVMWDHTFLTRHVPGDSFEDYDRVLDEAAERGYNTLRIDPLPQSIDLSKPEQVYRQKPTDLPYLPWTRPEGFEGPAGAWLIEFVEKARRRGLYYVLSSWWGSGIQPLSGEHPKTLQQGAGTWSRFLGQWEKRFGFEGCVYVDLNNEFPCFLPGAMERLEKEGGPKWSTGWREMFQKEINEALALMREAFPQLFFCVSLHADVPYTELDLEMDCMDIHFYATFDPRWNQRTRFWKYCPELFKSAEWHKDFSDRCEKARAAAALFRARQRTQVAAFTDYGRRRGIPLLTTEAWASWYYIDSPDLDWSWLLEWAQWSVEDAIDYQMWGWTPHNYVQPQFANWKDAAWHRRLTERFLRS